MHSHSFLVGAVPLGLDAVLILVVMEDALALFIQNTGGSGGHVLILVVMEDALAPLCGSLL